MSLHVGVADRAAGFTSLTNAIATKFGAAPPKTMEMNDYNTEWDTLYPFSAVSLYGLSVSADLCSS